MLNAKEQALFDALNPVAQAEGVEIVTIEVLGSKKSPTVRVYIDVEGGVSFDELSSAQVWVNEVVDKLDPFPGAYLLEVSSPGIDRPLRTEAHFAAQLGKTAHVKMKHAHENRSIFTGEIAEVQEGVVTIVTEDGASYKLPVDDMKKAHIKGVIDFSEK